MPFLAGQLPNMKILLSRFRYLFLLFLLVFLPTGIAIYYHPSFCHLWGPCFDISGYSTPLSIFLLFLCGAAVGQLWVSPVTPYEHVICLQCDKAFRRQELHNYRCPSCGGGVEHVEEFYNRHPEKRAPTPAEISASDEPGDKLQAQAAEPHAPARQAIEPQAMAKPAPKPKVIRMGILDTLREYRTPVPRHGSSRALSGQRPEGAASGNENPAPGRKEDA